MYSIEFGEKHVAELGMDCRISAVHGNGWTGHLTNLFRCV